MILDMARIRMLGPIEELQPVLGRVQDIGLVHLVEPSEGESLKRLDLTAEQDRHIRSVRKVAEDVHAAIALLEAYHHDVEAAGAASYCASEVATAGAGSETR